MFDKLIALVQVFFVMVTSWLSGLGLLPNNMTVEPTVFVAENEYQIIWETKRPSAAWVVVGDAVFADSEAGNLYWNRKIHKVSVPMEALDEAKGYEVHWQHTMRANWEVRKGDERLKAYGFRPIDCSDGLQIYNISDTHSSMYPGATTAGYWGDQLDLLILNGDILNDIQKESDLTFGLQLAWEITKGERPVLYARGNHETRGAYANDLHRYVGAPGVDRWYFTTRVGPLWIAVYDVGEDKADDHAEYNGLADYAQYRQHQRAFFDGVLVNADAEFNAPGVEYRLLVCHIPFGAGGRPFADDLAYYLAQSNEMGLDAGLSGHTHRRAYYPAGEYAQGETKANYPVIIGTTPGENFTGAALELKGSAMKLWFTDPNRAVVEAFEATR